VEDFFVDKIVLLYSYFTKLLVSWLTTRFCIWNQVPDCYDRL